MKKYFNFLLLAALLCGMSMSVISCKSDDDNNSEPSDDPDPREEQFIARLGVLTQLAAVSSEDDFLANTYDPIIGVAESEGSNTRIVITNSLEQAAEQFSELVGAEIDTLTNTYTWSDDQMGSLVYNRATDGKAWATVDVKIKQVPKLEKIIFRSSEQGGDNASFKSIAYYRFGDVVYTPYAHTRNGETIKDTTYWICVRPPFALAKDPNCYWIGVGGMPDRNIYTYYRKSKAKDGEYSVWYLPTKLGNSETHMQNLAELLYAILEPEDWYRDLSASKAPKTFTGFKKDTLLKYHNVNFWKNVQKGWDNNKVWQNVFKKSKDEMKQMLATKGLNLIYNGYSWIFKSSWNCTLWHANYKNGMGTQANMHKSSLTKPSKNMKKVWLDFRTPKSQDFSDFFNNDNVPRWPVLYRTNQNLDAGTDVNNDILYEPTKTVYKQALYRYYADIVEHTDKEILNGKIKPEVTLTNLLDADRQ